MNRIKKITGAKTLSKKQQQDVHGGALIFSAASNRGRGCKPLLSCCYHNGTSWVQGPPCF
ncbi:hypothetical protein [Aquimarina sp. SS2-1]|uniref:hypothetical protein n=1 Tax=Aquimarina besae TaxID=3342247 RepID=UPI003671B6CD